LLAGADDHASPMVLQSPPVIQMMAECFLPSLGSGLNQVLPPMLLYQRCKRAPGGFRQFGLNLALSLHKVLGSCTIRPAPVTSTPEAQHNKCQHSKGFHQCSYIEVNLIESQGAVFYFAHSSPTPPPPHSSFPCQIHRTTPRRSEAAHSSFIVRHLPFRSPQ
jgi:hypothetical protein